MIKPIIAFKACILGAVHPTLFTPDDELSDEAAAVALELGCLSEEDAQTMRKNLDTPPPSEDAKAAEDAKAIGGAPENKLTGKIKKGAAK